VNSNASGGAVRRSSVAIQWVLTRKELRETLRDRRTLVTLFAMPLLLYPLLGLVFRLVALQTKAGEIGAEYRVAAAGVPDAQWLSSMLNSTDVDTGEDGGQQRGTAPRFVLVESRDPLEPRDAVARRVADVGVWAAWRRGRAGVVA